MSWHSCGYIPAQQVGTNAVLFPKGTKQNFISVLSIHYTVLGINSVLQSALFYSTSHSQMVIRCVQIWMVEFIPLEIPYSCPGCGPTWNLRPDLSVGYLECK